MSKVAQRGSAAAKSASASDESLKKEETCPVCKAGRYLNAHIKFLINPECYHKMCESCVDRLFSSGPRSCPIAGCDRTLRKNKFRPQTFEDTQIEREVDIRRRVSKIFNKVEDDFETLRAYNDYLADVEDITFNLVHQIDVEDTTRKLERYQAANSKEIAENAARASTAAQAQAQRSAAQEEAARLRREADRLEDEQERADRLAGRANIIEQLASGTTRSAEEIAAKGRAGLLKRRTGGTKAIPSRGKPTPALPNEPSDASSDFQISGLKKRPVPVASTPYTPLAGWRLSSAYHAPQAQYEASWLAKFGEEEKYVAGGFAMDEYYGRIFTEAFAGLGVSVDEEMAANNIKGMSGGLTKAVPTVSATNAAVSNDVNMSDDVF